jgi:alpha-galactosidase
LAGAQPPGNAKPESAVALLTPPAPPQPRIHGPKVYGVRPGSPFLYRIPATGQRPMTFAAEGLPEGLSLDAATGIITGRAAKAGTYRVTLTAANSLGRSKRELAIEVGPHLALTPPMGWNSWYIHYHRVSDKVLREAAEQMIATGMADYGYQYVNIDDCWAVRVGSNDPEIGGPTRDADGRIRPNRRFPDMKALTAFIHAKGLKAGIYTSPGRTTCAGYEGAFSHEALDARTFADWGFDFLKYDWCSYGNDAGGGSLEHMQRPYRKMWAELQKLDRDLVFNLCQYGMGNVWTWGGQVGHCWRTTGDLGVEPAKARLPGFYSIGFSNAAHWENAHSGAWNDPDYILIGWVGDAHHSGEGRPTTLTPDEQYSYMSMWCLMAAPLVFSGDMAKLDPFTLNVLCNHEVIEVDQDPLGRQARIVRKTAEELVLSKELGGGSRALGLFNLQDKPAQMSYDWAKLSVMHPKQSVRDLWRQKDLGQADGKFEIEVPAHGVAMLRLTGAPAMAKPRIVIREEEEPKMGVAPPPAQSIFAPGAKLEKLAGGFAFTEGPACDAKGNVYFTDQPNDRIMRWSTDGKLSTFMKPCGRSNGLCFDAKGNLWACADEKNELWSIDPAGKATVVVNHFQGKLLNGPNDVWVRPDGGLYITDPYYPRPYWHRGPKAQQSEAVYYLPPPPGGNTLVRVVDDMKQPNGIIGTPDGKILYVSDIGAGRTFSYRIQPDGTLAHKQLFCKLGSDGMTIDSEGNVYLTGHGVTVFDPTGRQIARVEVAEAWTGNICFGGSDRQTLFITASRGLYAIRTRVHGVGSQ